MSLPELYFSPYYFPGRNPLEFLSPFQHTGTVLMMPGTELRIIGWDKGFVKDYYFYGTPVRSTTEWFIDIREVYLITNDSLGSSDHLTDARGDQLMTHIAVPLTPMAFTAIQAQQIGFIVDPKLLIPYYGD